MAYWDRNRKKHIHRTLKVEGLARWEGMQDSKMERLCKENGERWMNNADSEK